MINNVLKNVEIENIKFEISCMYILDNGNKKKLFDSIVLVYYLYKCKFLYLFSCFFWFMMIMWESYSCWINKLNVFLVVVWKMI